MKGGMCSYRVAREELMLELRPKLQMRGRLPSDELAFQAKGADCIEALRGETA